MTKFELTAETRTEGNTQVHRIRATRDFGNVQTGDLGGWVEKETNLSHEGGAWVFDDAQVSGEARVHDDAQVHGNARISGNAQIHDDAQVYGNAQVSGHAQITEDAQVYGNARVSGHAQISDVAEVEGEAEVSGEARVACDPLVVTGFPRNITVTDFHIGVAGTQYTPATWAAKGEEVVRNLGFTPEEAALRARVISELAEVHGCAEPEG